MQKIFLYLLIGLNLIFTIQLIEKVLKLNKEKEKITKLENKYMNIKNEYKKLSSNKKNIELYNKIDYFAKKNSQLLRENVQFTNWYIEIGGQ